MTILVVFLILRERGAPQHAAGSPAVSSGICPLRCWLLCRRHTLSAGRRKQQMISFLAAPAPFQPTKCSLSALPSLVTAVLPWLRSPFPGSLILPASTHPVIPEGFSDSSVGYAPFTPFIANSAGLRAFFVTFMSRNSDSLSSPLVQY